MGPPPHFSAFPMTHPIHHVSARQLFLNSCLSQLAAVEQGACSIESAAERLVAFFLSHEELLFDPELESIFAAAGRAELPRETSYAQPIGHWNAGEADRLKQEEWQEVARRIRAYAASGGSDGPLS